MRDRGKRLLAAVAGALIGVALGAAAERVTPGPQLREPVELNLLVSLGGAGLREHYVKERLERFAGENPDIQVQTTFVESDTLAFLKLLYAGNKYSYDVVCMGDDAMLSAVEQKLVRPVDGLLMERLGLPWLDAVPEACLENTFYGGNMYGLPFIKSRLRVYRRGTEGGSGPVCLEELMKAAGGMNPLGLPADVLLRDLLLSAGYSGWDMLEGRTEGYRVNGPDQIRLLEAMQRGLKRGSLISGDYEGLIRGFCSGRLETVVLADIYEDALIEGTDGEVGSVPLYREEGRPWLYQGANLYLAERGEAHDYGPAYDLMEFLVKGENLDQLDREAGSPVYKRVLSRKNTKAYLIVDRMIADFLHGNEDCRELINSLQSQLETVLEE